MSSSFAPTPVPGATLVPQPIELVFAFTTSATGRVFVPGIAGGVGPLSLYLQFGVLDPGLPFGFTRSNALRVDFLL